MAWFFRWLPLLHPNAPPCAPKGRGQGRTLRPCRKFAAKSVSFEPCRMVRCPKTCKHVRGEPKQKARGNRLGSFVLPFSHPVPEHIATLCALKDRAIFRYLSHPQENFFNFRKKSSFFKNRLTFHLTVML